MYLFDLGYLPGQQSMLVFHALARLGVEGLSIVSPASPLVSIGYFQDAGKEVDLAYCRDAGIPPMRREIGGGATYLDADQIFYQLILRKDNPLAHGSVASLYERFSQAPVETYAEFGIKTAFRPVNDIVTSEGRKIAGEGAGDIGECMVFVGGILLDFDYETMAHVLKVPDEKFRDKVYKTMQENLTTMRQELGEAPPRQDVVKALIQSFEKITGRLTGSDLTSEGRALIGELDHEFNRADFLLKKTPKRADGVRIRHGVEVLFGTHKAPGGLIRSYQEVKEQRLDTIGLSGDFTVFPRDSLEELERSLRGSPRAAKQVEDRIARFYEQTDTQSPGVTVDDWVQAVEKAQAGT
jgi:lipoate-protein ligase A